MEHLTGMKVFTILVLAVGACTAEIFTTEQLQTLDKFVEDVLACSELPGLALAVVKDNDTFTKGYGKRDIENDKNVNADTLFCIASVTKAMTSALLAKLLPEKFPKSLWDTKIKDILDDSFKLSTSELTDQVTVKDILSHRTGAISGMYGLFAGYPDNITRSDLAKKLRYLPSSLPLRYGFIYNNWMYVLAGYLAEVLAEGEQSWEELMTRHIFKPLGMNSTTFTKIHSDPAQQTELALPYIFTNGSQNRMSSEIFNIFPAEPAGGVVSSANDMAKWMQFLLRSPKDIVDDEVLQETMESHMVIESGYKRPELPVDKYTYAYGMGWGMGAYRGRQITEHGGSIFAYTSSLSLLPHSRIGVFTITNGMVDRGFQNHHSTILSYIIDMILREDPWLNSTTACTFPEPWLNIPYINFSKPSYPEEESQRPLSDYVGVYGHELIGDAHIFTNKTLNRLQLKLGEKIQADLYPTSQKDIFRLEVIGLFWFLANPEVSTFHFGANTDGQVKNMTSASIGKEFVFRKGVRFNGAFSGSSESSSASPPISQKTPSASPTISQTTWLHFALAFFFCVFKLHL